MARATCSSCGLRRQTCQCRQEFPLAGNANGDDGETSIKLTQASSCVIHLVTAIVVTGCFYLLIFHLIGNGSHSPDSCYLEVFVDSFSVSNASIANSNATADWNVSFVTKSPGNGCKVSLHMINSRLLRGEKLISESFTPDYFGKVVKGEINELVSYVVYKMVAMPQGIGSGVVWDLRVNFVSSFNVHYLPHSRVESPGFLIVNCDGIPVNFTADPAGNVKGSLLGRMRPCEYLFLDNYTDTTF